ncbi:MAG: hypothetical protein JNL09_04340 [Anaerolineales bacterium]|nr:hypothetical protein [Anaerolineales bacterium]
MPGELTLYQNDPRWQNDLLGFATDGNSTIGKFGCLLTSLAMTANALGADETPATLNEKMKAVQAFQGPWVRAHQIGAAVPGLRVARNVECRDVPAPLADIDATLAASRPVIVLVDYSPDPGVQDHWIVIYGKQGGDYLIRDPWRGPRSDQTLSQKYGFAGTPAEIINRVIWIEGAGTTSAPAPKPAQPVQPVQPPVTRAPATSTSAPAGSELVVVALVDQLTLRSQPLINENNVVRRYAAQARLRVVEPAAEARPKLGAQGSWLKVRDVEGREGFVAAWLVTAAEAPALGPRPAVTGPRADAPSALVVRTTADGVVLRRAPRVANDTQLKLLAANAELLVIEAGSAATKIGANGQWLQVRDLQGTEGFVAAWFVRRA